MIALILALALSGSQDQQAKTDANRPEDPATALIEAVSGAIDAEKARQAALAPAVTDREKLERMGLLDQVGRRASISVDVSALLEEERKAAEAAAWAPIETLDRAHLTELLAMLPPEGWFLESVYGERAASAAFLIVQHSDLEQWRRFVPVLEPLVAAGEVDGQRYGLMYDRLAINENRPQRYGTQMTCKEGRWAIDQDNLEDPANADKRRAEMGFRQTLSEYEANFAHYPPCTP
ncbi:hypothetical protein D3C80_1115220 [compost metagenome]